MEFSEKDIQQINSAEVNIKDIEKQIENFKNGFPYILLMAPATIENKGVLFLSEDDVNSYANIYQSESQNKNLLKFVPASGAATRMFKDLYEVSDNYMGDYENFSQEFPDGYKFIQSLEKFAFWDELKKILDENGFSIQDCLAQKKYNVITDFLIKEKGLNYGKLPKALLYFHKYDHEVRTAMEEHLVEGVDYALSDRNVSIHFTLSEEHISLFEEKVRKVLRTYEEKFNVQFTITTSIQKRSTNTIAVTENNELFRDSNGNLVFRPGGHGALIENLNECNADIIFIKNIDNVVPDRLKYTTSLYKKALAGLLISVQNKIFEYLNLLDKASSDNNLLQQNLNEIENFMGRKLNLVRPDNYSRKSLSEKIKILKEKLNKPIRICGMVKNTGEPGGGPFFVCNMEGDVSFQIVESSQINHNDTGQESLFKSSTHFNPVDIVCGIKDYKGNKFNLTDFIDPDTGFISAKSKDGKMLKAQELPGLWNGAMANWITIFVEVPLITFNPVKTVNDLLRPEHQSF